MEKSYTERRANTVVTGSRQEFNVLLAAFSIAVCRSRMQEVLKSDHAIRYDTRTSEAFQRGANAVKETLESSDDDRLTCTMRNATLGDPVGKAVAIAATEVALRKVVTEHAADLAEGISQLETDVVPSVASDLL